MYIGTCVVVYVEVMAVDRGEHLRDELIQAKKSSYVLAMKSLIIAMWSSIINRANVVHIQANVFICMKSSRKENTVNRENL